MRVLSILAAAVLIAGIGCSGKKVEVTGEGGKKLTMTAPGNTSIKQGDTTKITVKIKREKFEDPIDVTFTQLPDDVTVKESSTKIDKDSTEGTFTLEAKDKAPLKKGQQVKVTVSAAGMQATETFMLDVVEKK